MEQLSVSARTDFIHHSGLEIEEHSTRHVLAGASLAEESVEGIITTTDSLVRWHLPIGLNAVLKAEQLPAGVAYLDTTLSDMDRDNFSHKLA